MDKGLRSQFLIYQTDSGQTKIDVRFENETVWLTQALIAELFQTTPQNITLHIKNVYEEGELLESATCKDFLQVRIEGNRKVKRTFKHYNLDGWLPDSIPGSDSVSPVGYRTTSRIYCKGFCA